MTYGKQHFLCRCQNHLNTNMANSGQSHRCTLPQARGRRCSSVYCWLLCCVVLERLCRYFSSQCLEDGPLDAAVDWKSDSERMDIPNIMEKEISVETAVVVWAGNSLRQVNLFFSALLHRGSKFPLHILIIIVHELYMLFTVLKDGISCLL